MRKVFGSKTAVENLTLDVQRGEVFGFLGPNGAGKTTSVKMLLGLISPTSGGAALLGEPTGTTRVLSAVGFLPEHFRFHEWLTAMEFLELHAALYGQATSAGRKKAGELLDLVGLSGDAEKKLEAFSKGMLQRIGLAQALINDPKLVFLDEPTSGLDPVGRRLVRDIIRQLKQRETTVFLNSHFLSEVEITCDRVAYIKEGRVIRTDRLDAFLDGEIQVEIQAKGVTPDVEKGLLRWGRHLRRNGTLLTLTTDSMDVIPLLNRYLLENGVDVYAIRPDHLSLEERFLQVIGDDSLKRPGENRQE